MISDEMRELLSAYVDGELRDVDAARVEEISKRDPELRREIESYRRMRAKLRAWDEAENALEPSPELGRRALQRARSYVAATGPRRAWFVEPAAIAAALLIALVAGLLAAWSVNAPGPEVVFSPEEVKLPEPAPLDDYSLPHPDVMFSRLPEPPPPRGDLTLPEAIERYTYGYLDKDTGAVVSARAIDFREEQRILEEQTARRRDRAAAEKPVETVTNEWRPRVDLVRAYTAVAAPVESLVLLTHPARDFQLPAAAVLPAGERIAMDHAGDPNSVVIELRSDRPHLALAGEVWVGERDKSGRTRVLGATSWVDGVQFVPVVWADRIELPSRLLRLESKGAVLGPKARRQLLLAKDAQDPAFVDWLTKESKGRSLSQVFAEGAPQRRKSATRLVQYLADDPKTTGFAVVAGEKVMGFELFGSHELMLECAPRLLPGYLVEAGPKGIELKGGSGATLQKAEELLNSIHQRSTSLEEADAGPRDGWPEGLRCVNLRDGFRRIVGHGLVQGERPVHLTLFGED